VSAPLPDLPAAPPAISEYASRVVEYVRRALGVELTYDSDTLPVLDHYLRNVPTKPAAALELVITTASAYFGEVVRNLLGGRWESTGEPFRAWRMILPTGVQFSPAGFVAAAIAHDDVDDFETELDAPARMKPYLVEALARMGEVGEDEYYSLCGRLDTLEHVHEVLVGEAARLLGDQPDGTEAEDDADVEPEPGTDPGAN
jgi:hypothetical protein